MKTLEAGLRPEGVPGVDVARDGVVPLVGGW